MLIYVNFIKILNISKQKRTPYDVLLFEVPDGVEPPYKVLQTSA